MAYKDYANNLKTVLWMKFFLVRPFFNKAQTDKRTELTLNRYDATNNNILKSVFLFS